MEKKLLDSMKTFNESSGLPYLVEASYGWDLRSASDLSNLDDCVNRADDKMYEMKFGKRMSNRFSGKVQEEIGRRLSSAKQRVFLLSADNRVQEEAAKLFDERYLLFPVSTAEEALEGLTAAPETALLLVDDQGQTGLTFIRDMPGTLRRNTIPVLLLESEDAETIAEAFAMGVEVLVKPYNRVLNKCRINLLSHLNLTNQKLTQMLEQQADL